MIHYHYWETLVGTVMLENLQDTSAKKTKKIKHVQKQEEFGSRKICMCVCVCVLREDNVRFEQAKWKKK